MFSKLFCKSAKHVPGEPAASASGVVALAESTSTLRKPARSLPIVFQELPDFEGAMDALAAEFSAEWIYARLGGVISRGTNEAQRDADLAQLKPLVELRLTRDTDCLYHDNAIIVSTNSGVQLGSLERHIAEDMTIRKRSGTRFACFLCSIHTSAPYGLLHVKLAIMSW